MSYSSCPCPVHWPEWCSCVERDDMRHAIQFRRLVALLFTATELGALAYAIEQAQLREQRRAARGLPCNSPAHRDYQDDE